MGNTQTRATEKWREKAGIKKKSFNLKEDLIDEYVKACEKAGVSQTSQIAKMMKQFIDEVNKPE